MLTIADVEQKTFSTALRGYDLDEVDDFLDEIVATIRTLNDQLDEARAAAEAPVVTAPITETESAVVPVPEPELDVEPEPQPEPAAEAPAAGLDESAIGRALIAAQTAADRLLEDARGEAGRIVEVAKSEADSWSEEREAKRREAEAEIARLTDRVASVRSELSVLAGEVAEKLDEMDAVIHEAGEAEAPVPGSGAEISDGEVEGEPEPGPDAERWGYSVDESPEDEEPEGPSNAVDHLDAMLTGVVNDLQLPSDEPESHDHGNDEPWKGSESDDQDENE
jgi:DivIVA domain-containing protein